MVRRYWLAAGAILIAAAIVVVYIGLQSPSSADSRAMTLPVDPDPLTVETSHGERSFTVEIADDPGERERGLMFREDMDDMHGMLFVFEEQRDVGFWMKNTPMPLDLIFIGQDGKIRAIKKGEPQSEAIVSSGLPVRFVLELKAGTAARNGIEYGDLLRHPAIGTASGPGMPPVDNGDAPNAGG
jgi:uncharacterized membrane protein (UPF0127 family)